ncbi:MAG: 23S rRNA pseudouridine(2605) synthase RluB [Candidatus Azotimanducaceae bacterium]|uniref:Pseudouridine synthase n=1 Tax=OM182 bacterium TaxID=2510334 RepID=A0A520S194_9GAMM|nr:23S rRNA pseudouridylate synthase B [Gammaproteobacteria bacterium]OUV68788.1 MAG: 23S rRNA pseudouridylate synthase B [Gammaproteobacteria bacterium TMED133]RZO76224.1 MAG: pseudouridine synthase [OM182 bacterium]
MSQKLQKTLANAGLGSRRAMENWIGAGRIKVNGTIAKLGDRVLESDTIQVDGHILAPRKAAHRHLLYNKPAGEICSRDDPEGRHTVFRNLPKLKNQRWISIGRLDFNTSGLLLFTTDGELANKLAHPSSCIDREYAVRVLGNVTDENLRNLREGVTLEDGLARFTDIKRPLGSVGANHWYYVVLMEGRNREVRRLWESQGLTVSRLKRVRFGSFFVPSRVKVGRFLELGKKETDDLYDLARVRKD